MKKVEEISEAVIGKPVSPFSALRCQKKFENLRNKKTFCHKILNFITISRNMHQNSIKNNFNCNFNNNYRNILFFTLSSRNSMKIKSKSNAENNLVFFKCNFFITYSATESKLKHTKTHKNKNRNINKNTNINTNTNKNTSTNIIIYKNSSLFFSMKNSIRRRLIN